MVTKITFPKRMQDALNYNEQKVKKGVADCLLAYGYLRKLEGLNFYGKLEGLEQRNSLNERATTKTLHASLNFSPQDHKLDSATLIGIAKDYMKGIGFGDQPYLVYCHRDAGHPHLHIVSTTIQADGSRIPTHNLGRNESSKIRVELEEKYNLIPAKDRTLSMASDLHQMPLPAQYGKEETHNAIARIVNHVFNNYTYGSLAEYNAALRSFGVTADRGSKEGRTYRHGGLVYRMLDERGERVGVPIKASSLPGRPTLSALEQRFAVAGQKKANGKSALIEKIDAAINVSSSLSNFIRLMAGQGVFVLPRQNRGGPVYGITFVDHQTGYVFNGSDLGKPYSAASLLSKFPSDIPAIQMLNHSSPTSLQEKAQKVSAANTYKTVQGATKEQVSFASPQPYDAPPPAGLMKKRKRKHARSINS